MLEGYAPALGFDEFWGWQHHVLGPALEIDDDGEWWYQEVTVIIGRQSGKTTGLIAARVLVGLMRGEKIAFSMQNRVFGLEKWAEIVELLERAIGPDLAVRKQRGEERARLKGGGVFRLVTPTSDGARSFTADTIIADESALIRPAYLAAARPVMATRVGFQIWLVSSAGFPTSEDLARSRAAAYADLKLPPGQGRSAITEWGTERLDNPADYGDEELWKKCLPTLGEPGGVQLSFLRNTWPRMKPQDFAREFLGVWGFDPLDRPIESDVWSRVVTADTVKLRGVVLAVDAHPRSEHASIVAAGPFDDSGRIGVQLLAHGPGDDWLQNELDAAWGRFSPMKVVVDSINPAVAIAADCEARGRTCVKMPLAGVVGACAGFVSRAKTEKLLVVHDDDLTAAAVTATRRSTSGGWLFDRRPLLDDSEPPAISPIVAASMAVHERAKVPLRSAATMVPDPDQAQRSAIIARLMDRRG